MGMPAPQSDPAPLPDGQASALDGRAAMEAQLTKVREESREALRMQACAAEVRALSLPRARAVVQHDGPNHLGLRSNAQQMARITSDCVQMRYPSNKWPESPRVVFKSGGGPQARRDR